MKNFFLGLSLAVLSLNTLATGGFYCVTSEIENQVEIWGTTGRMYGNPLVGEVGVNVTNGPQLMYSRTQVVGYWNMGKSFKLALIDENFEKLEYQVEAELDETADFPVAKGTIELENGVTTPITCELE